MAHKLDYSKGSAAIAYNINEGTPWHREGVAIKGRFTVQEAFASGGIDFRVKKQDLLTVDGIKADNHVAVVREDTNKILGIVSRKYAPLQNTDAAAFFNELTANNQAIFETVGSLDEGRTIWFLAKLDAEPVKIISDDVVDQYLLFTNNHSGLYAARARFTPIRVVCANTLGWAMQRKAKEEVVVKHTGNVEERVKFAGQLLAQAGEFYNELTDGYRQMAKTTLNNTQIIAYIKESLRPYKPQNATEEELEVFEEKSEPNQLKKEIDSVLNLIETGRGSDIKGVRGTLWGAYNGITEYVDHYKSKSSKLTSTEYIMRGVGSLIKKKAIKIALDYAKNPTKSKLTLV
jgi:phage/plasmid-like protein (TIGR03299 family)